MNSRSRDEQQICENIRLLLMHKLEIQTNSKMNEAVIELHHDSASGADVTFRKLSDFLDWWSGRSHSAHLSENLHDTMQSFLAHSKRAQIKDDAMTLTEVIGCFKHREYAGSTIYVVRMLAVATNEDAKVQPLRLPYNNYILGLKEVGGTHFFSTKEKAENALKDLADICSVSEINPYMSTIERVPFDQPSMSEAVEWWAYDDRSLLIDQSVYTAYIDEHFPEPYPGRTPQQIRYRVGDFAYRVNVDLYGKYFAEPVIIVRTPLAVDEVNKLNRDTIADDECYHVYSLLDGKSSAHPMCLRRIPDYMLKEVTEVLGRLHKLIFGKHHITLVDGHKLPCDITENSQRVVLFLKNGLRNPYNDKGCFGGAYARARGHIGRIQDGQWPLVMKNRRKICSDSRLFLTKRTITGAMESAGFKCGLKSLVTYGAYLEWWASAPESVDSNGNHILYFSDSRQCRSVAENGEIVNGELKYPVDQVWQSFLAVNDRYAEATAIYSRHTPRQFIEILKSDTSHPHNNA